ncbi:LRR receptor kinase BAK1 isoform X2 [Physcomitrium patens]|uniref:non-specific serine/threonine protein kinase n=1 Tax=Physcomitrium patens TaxID=3218 RepID=A0A7I4DB58_PHYPA|nr:LRR receptor kinase BAK1-like isoform X2 [Physcomitrium patens]|eukprot:XP_024371644.1 LRR receptor kinase BAK1-like isoform X2 [Physcomitrella patens]
MQSLHRQGLQCWCLLLLCLSNGVRATVEEGKILIDWKAQLEYPNDKLRTWSGSDPCFNTNPWDQVSCDPDGFVIRIGLGSSNLTGTLTPEFGQIKRLNSLILSDNHFNGSIPEALGDLSELIFLDLSNNYLSGSIPSTLGNLTKLNVLKLNNNHLSGSIPIELAALPNLRDIHLEFNNLSGRIPISGVFGTASSSNFAGNPLLCGDQIANQCVGDPPRSSSTSISIGPIIGGALGGIVFLASVGGLCFWCKRRHPSDAFFDVPEEDTRVNLGQLTRFTLSQLKNATENFSSRNEIGRGGFGIVYKGVLSDGTQLAIKRLKLESRSIGNEKQFQTEVEIISMASHRNLLRLYGLCTTPTERLLVYPYMANRSVSFQLKKTDHGAPAMTCQMRKRIALGAAKGLAYLHEQCNPKIIHRDVKADNILLDDEFEAVVGDFGLAKPIDFKNTHVTTAIRGTIGHIAPEYMSSGKSSEKTDVYGYGITLLQLITGQSALNLSRLADDDVMLLDWVRKLEKENNVEKMIDPHLKEYNMNDIKELLKVALLCTENNPTSRPKMSEVVNMLEGEGLEERWAEWEQREVQRNQEALDMPHLPVGWNLDSNSSFMQALELSGPR